jgi:hypothetical protein
MQGLIHHSDPGSRCTSIAFAETLMLEQIAGSIGSIGDAYDNAPVESTIGLFKTEAVGNHSPFLTGPPRTVDDVEYATMHGSTGTTTGARTACSATCLTAGRSAPLRSTHGIPAGDVPTMKPASNPRRFNPPRCLRCVNVEKKPHPAGDSVVVTFDGKLLPYDWTAAEA